jgi:hypothetical protein
VATSIDSVLASITLSELSLKGEQLGVKRDTDSDFSYVI